METSHQQPFSPSSITDQFAHLLRERRLNELQSRATKGSGQSRAASTNTIATHYTTEIEQHGRATSLANQDRLRSYPTVPSPPADPHSIKFCHMIRALSITPTQYENPGLLDEALGLIPLDRIYQEAEEANQKAIADIQHQLRATSNSGPVKSKWGYQDFVIQALLRWFPASFFSFVNNPTCTSCSSPTIAVGMAASLPEEYARGASRVEIYRCSNPACSKLERFPRYSCVWTLLQTRCGRAGEWANCFSMLCRALGARVRWVWNSEDLVWSEVYSEHARRWVHVDACEGVWDNPRMYTEGWKRRLGYCIAFSNLGAYDVTRRYVRDPSYALPRTRATESSLLWALNEIKATRRASLSRENQRRAVRRDALEEAELKAYTVQSMVRAIESAGPSSLLRAPAFGNDIKRTQEIPARWEWQNVSR